MRADGATTDFGQRKSDFVNPSRDKGLPFKSEWCMKFSRHGSSFQLPFAFSSKSNLTAISGRNRVKHQYRVCSNCKWQSCQYSRQLIDLARRTKFAVATVSCDFWSVALLTIEWVRLLPFTSGEFRCSNCDLDLDCRLCTFRNHSRYIKAEVGKQSFEKRPLASRNVVAATKWNSGKVAIRMMCTSNDTWICDSSASQYS